MTRFVHDQFAKDYLGGLLEPFGEVKAPLKMSGEVREIDVCFKPTTLTDVDRAKLGLLGRFALTTALFEPFRNPAKPPEICNCLLKLLEMRGDFQREANRNNTRIVEESLPRLWILTPTASEQVLYGFRAELDENNWLPGIYFMANYLRTAIVVIHQLPRTEETLWLRLLGKEGVQEQAIDEVEAISQDNPLRKTALDALQNLRTILELRQDLEQDEQRLIMRLEPIYRQRLEEATQQGIQQGQRSIIENLFRARFGSLDGQLSAMIDRLLALPSDEFTSLLLQLPNLSREELLARCGEK